MDQYFREPASAAVIAMAITMGYIYMKARMNNEGLTKNSEMIKPGFLVGILVYFIVSQSQGTHELASKEPF
jgi:uncharacterized membrane protein YphA (DoxX/SURF4 family)